MEQVLQVVGAVLILVAYVLAQIGVVRPDAYLYLLLNLSGSTLLAVLAWSGQQWGFLLLEGVWALVSLWSLGRRLRGAETFG
ncbi:MAG: hypothetical protein IRZ14_01940 [Chloroflexi bacterium]|mgnify:CR=1 FL=1|jgi:hypothetical protein|nr:hypothetical protein [Chloroflexota bacterium]